MAMVHKGVREGMRVGVTRILVTVFLQRSEQMTFSRRIFINMLSEYVGVLDRLWTSKR